MLGLRVSVDLLDFLRSGRFDVLRLGWSQERVLHNFPDPDDVDVRGRDAPEAIWRYGNIELHFIDHTLHAIFSDYVTSLAGGPSITIDRWLLDGRRTLAEVIDALTREAIDFAKYTKPLDRVELVLSSGVRLTFDAQSDAHDARMDPRTLPLVALDLTRRSSTDGGASQF